MNEFCKFCYVFAIQAFICYNSIQIKGKQSLNELLQLYFSEKEK